MCEHDASGEEDRVRECESDAELVGLEPTSVAMCAPTTARRPWPSVSSGSSAPAGSAATTPTSTPTALGYAIAAVVRIRPAPGQLQRIPQIAGETPEVAECNRITGEDCCLLRLHLRSMDDFEDVLDRFTPHGLTTST